MPWGLLSLCQKWVPETETLFFWGVKRGRCVGLTTLPPSVSRLSTQCGILNILYRYGPSWPSMGIALNPEEWGHMFLRKAISFSPDHTTLYPRYKPSLEISLYIISQRSLFFSVNLNLGSGVYSASNRIQYRKISGVKALPARKGDNLVGVCKPNV
jgi:hypothetical protein